MEECTLEAYDNCKDMCIPVFGSALIVLGSEKGLYMRQIARPWSGASFSLEDFAFSEFQEPFAASEFS